MLHLISSLSNKVLKFIVFICFVGRICWKQVQKKKKLNYEIAIVPHDLLIDKLHEHGLSLDTVTLKIK